MESLEQHIRDAVAAGHRAVTADDALALATRVVAVQEELSHTTLSTSNRALLTEEFDTVVDLARKVLSRNVLIGYTSAVDDSRRAQAAHLQRALAEIARRDVLLLREIGVTDPFVELPLR
ncbi:hypothetical protein [Nocardia stercoris]|uniref:Uncharacterized protein n=1 Tax=Nocardia stercoris TaxID=2483361 RepID=A0A3M2KXV8_9NOCA|nr:hypothetical protein [Nocardia stercoris]RMI29486.1 hypothetical protein EBN03_25750 [Nocardia stercoris]